jgi:lysophospholipase L1-like esterase
MRIYIIGDSISIHYGLYLQAYLRGVIEYARKEGDEEALLNLDRPAGANGGDSSMVRAFLQAKMRAGGIKTDVLLLNCGLHDIKTDPATGAKQVPLAQYQQNLRAILQTVGGPPPRVVWIRTTPCDGNKPVFCR